jgi:hypothetical protein
MSASRTSLIRNGRSTQGLGQARPGTADKYRNRDGNQKTSTDFHGKAVSLGGRVFERRSDVSSRWHAEGHGCEPRAWAGRCARCAPKQVGLAQGRRAPLSGVSRLSATVDRAHDDLDREAEDDEVSDYLPGDQLLT